MNLTKARRARILHSQGMSAPRIAVDIGETVYETKHLITAGYVMDLQERIDVPVDGRPWSVTMAKIYSLISAGLSKETPAEKDDSCPPTLPDGSSSMIIAPANIPLQQRALEWCLDEAARHGDNRVPDERVNEYFAGCSRDGKNIGAWLGSEELKPGVDLSFCAAAQGFAEFRASLPDEDRPPWRAGALEIMLDAKAGMRPGETWMSAEAVRAGAIPKPGAIVVYENTAAAGRGHVERLISVEVSDYRVSSFRSVGANERNRRWWVDKAPIRLDNASRADGSQRLRLLGFSSP